MKHLKTMLSLILLILFIPCCASASTLQLPADLTTIEAEAFMNSTSLNRVEIPEGTLQIGERAFAGSSAKKITLPKSLNSIAEDAFSDCQNLKLIVHENSYAHNWCIANQVSCEFFGANPDDYYLELIYSNVFQPSEWNYKASQKFADMVTERTDGHITVTYYGMNELDCYGDSVTQAVNGSLWIGLEEPSLFADYVGDCAAFVGPMLYGSDAEYNHVMDSDLVDDVKDRLAEENIHILDTHYSFGFRSVVTNKAITTPQNLKGVKLRATSSPMFMKTVECMGSTPIAMSFSECLLALPRGTIEGFEGSLITLAGAGEAYELVKKVALTRHLLAQRWMFMPEDIYQSIPEKWRDILDECAVECGVWEQQMVAQEEAKLTAFLKTKGVTFNEVDLDSFIEASAPVHEWIAEEYGADPELSGKIMRLVQSYRNSH